MARVGSALDNAVAEAFNSTIKVEFIHRHRFATREQARTNISAWITGFYKPTPPTQRLRWHVTRRLRKAHRRSPRLHPSLVEEPSTVSGD
jgi:transposase InsO family protein